MQKDKNNNEDKQKKGVDKAKNHSTKSEDKTAVKKRGTKITSWLKNIAIFIVLVILLPSMIIACLAYLHLGGNSNLKYELETKKIVPVPLDSLVGGSDLIRYNLDWGGAEGKLSRGEKLEVDGLVFLEKETLYSRILDSTELSRNYFWKVPLCKNGLVFKKKKSKVNEAKIRCEINYADAKKYMKLLYVIDSIESRMYSIEHKNFKEHIIPSNVPSNLAYIKSQEAISNNPLNYSNWFSVVKLDIQRHVESKRSKFYFEEDRLIKISNDKQKAKIGVKRILINEFEEIEKDSIRYAWIVLRYNSSYESWYLENINYINDVKALEDVYLLEQTAEDRLAYLKTILLWVVLPIS